RELWPVILSDKIAHLVLLQKAHDVFELVGDAARLLLLLIAQESTELQEVAPVYFVNIRFPARFLEVPECYRVRRERLRLFSEIRLFEVVRCCVRYRSPSVLHGR